MVATEVVNIHDLDLGWDVAAVWWELQSAAVVVEWVPSESAGRSRGFAGHNRDGSVDQNCSVAGCKRRSVDHKVGHNQNSILVIALAEEVRFRRVVSPNSPAYPRFHTGNRFLDQVSAEAVLTRCERADQSRYLLLSIHRTTLHMDVVSPQSFV